MNAEFKITLLAPECKVAVLLDGKDVGFTGGLGSTEEKRVFSPDDPYYVSHADPEVIAKYGLLTPGKHVLSFAFESPKENPYGGVSVEVRCIGTIQPVYRLKSEAKSGKAEYKFELPFVPTQPISVVI